LFEFSAFLEATHYSNQTGRPITITNISAKKRARKIQGIVPSDIVLELDHGAQGDLENQQDDEITITSSGMSDKRKLFPTNNSFNYVITMNKFSSKYEQFDINRAGSEDEMTTVASKKARKARKIKKEEEKAKKKAASRKLKKEEKAS